MALPARLREAIGERGDSNLVVTIDTRERCLLLYPLLEWDVIQARLESLSNMRRNARLMQRLLIGHATADYSL